MLHRESLAAKETNDDISAVVNTVVKAVTFIKESAMHTWLFASLYGSFIIPK